MTSDARRITVMTLNLRFGLADDGPNSWTNRKKAYPALLETIRPDFIGFQEANNFQTDDLTRLLTSYSHIGVRDPSPERWQNNVIFFRKEWECLESRHYFLSDTPEVQSKIPESRWPRQCTIGRFRKGADTLIHINTHFDFEPEVQEKSARLILRFLDAFPSGIPTILTGDFNTSPESRTYALFHEHGFKDLFGDGHESTFHGFTGKNLGGRIDWILYKGGLKGTNRSILRVPFEGVYPSDHYPVVSEFTFA
jgi:endonuclease/exonuclease/phosphatase family metal-dependent hydrolase